MHICWVLSSGNGIAALTRQRYENVFKEIKCAATDEGAEARPRFPGVSWWRALVGRWRREDRESYACYVLMVCCCVKGCSLALLNTISELRCCKYTAFTPHYRVFSGCCSCRHPNLVPSCSLVLLVSLHRVTGQGVTCYVWHGRGGCEIA